MKLDYSIFCAAATVEGNGVFGILEGGLEWMTAKSWPARIPSLALLAKFSFKPDECGTEYCCVVKITDPSGTLLDADLAVTLTPSTRIRHPELDSSFVAVYRYADLKLQTPGFHRFEFYIADKLVGAAQLEAIEVST